MWAKKIEERILNVKRRASRNERKQLKEQGVLVPKGKAGRKKKSPTTTAVPEMPEGETVESLEVQQKELQQLSKKTPPDLHKIRELMDSTFPKRRMEVLKDDVRVWKLLINYPPLKEYKGNEASRESIHSSLKPNFVLPCFYPIYFFSVHLPCRVEFTFLNEPFAASYC
jgi:hypothetical protein